MLLTKSARIACLLLFFIACAPLADSVSAETTTGASSDESIAPPGDTARPEGELNATLGDGDKSDKVKKRTFEIGLLLLGCVLLLGIVMLATTLLLGTRYRRLSRKQERQAAPDDPFWYLRGKAKSKEAGAEDKEQGTDTTENQSDEPS